MLGSHGNRNWPDQKTKHQYRQPAWRFRSSVKREDQCWGEQKFKCWVARDRVVWTVKGHTNTRVSICLFVWVSGCFACICVSVGHVYAVPTEARRGHWILPSATPCLPRHPEGSWSYRGLWAAMWVLETQPMSSVRACSALTDWASSSVPSFLRQDFLWLRLISRLLYS